MLKAILNGDVLYIEDYIQTVHTCNELNEQDDSGSTGLHLATWMVERNREHAPRILRRLLEAGADQQIEDWEGCKAYERISMNSDYGDDINSRINEVWNHFC